MEPRERLEFSGIEGRPPLKLPDGLRLILWPLMSLEHWDISRPMARMVITPPQGQPMLPDHPNWSWHEYGTERAKIMSIAVHPYLSGQPHRIAHVERTFEEILSRPGVACWSGEKILDWYLRTQKGTS